LNSSALKIIHFRIRERRQGREPCDDLRHAHRPEVPAVDADVQAAAVARQLPVAMTEDVNRTTALSRPNAQTEVASDDPDAVDADIPDMRLHAGPWQRQRRCVIVVSRD